MQLRTASAVLALLCAAACSSTVDGAGSRGSVASSPPSAASQSSAPPSSSPASSAPQSSAPASTAPSSGTATVDLGALVLQRSDVPSGWTATPNTDSDSSGDAEDKAVLSCLGFSGNIEADQVAQVHSDDYNQGDNQVSSDASQWQSAADVQQQVALITEPRAAGCFQTVLKQALASSGSAGTVGKVSVKIDNGPGGFPSDVIARLHATAVLSANGQTITVYVDTAFIAHGIVTAEVDFTGVGAQVTPSVSSGMVQAVAERVATA